MPAFATSKRGLGREVPAAVCRVRTEPECPEGNLREIRLLGIANQTVG